MNSQRVNIPEYVKQSGPKILAGTVKGYKGGKALRIPKDLLDDLVKSVYAKSPFRFIFTVSKKTLILRCLPEGKTTQQGTSVYRTWKTREGATSELISLAGILPYLEMTEKEVEGVFPAEVKDDELFVHFDRKL